ncbi:MAG: ABC transporter ATP-binding protein [Polyangiaceae bacterium]
MIAVTLQGLVVRFAEVAAVDRVDLEVRAGELLLLLGPSGCGKSTLLRSIAGFVTPDEGTIRFGEEDVTRLPPHERHTGMVFQSFALWPHLSVAENVAFGLRERRVEKAEIARRVQESLAAVRMGDRAARRIDQLSGGEQQRVALARALVIRPRCLLLDEPLSNLDASLRHSMRDEIRRVCKEFKLTAVYVTHDQKEALAVADRIAVMKNGRILQIDSPIDVYRRPRSRAVAEFIGETNLLPAVVESVDASEICVRTPIGELVTQVRPDLDIKVGKSVWVSLRPECFSLSAERAYSLPNATVGEIESTSYLGEIAEHKFRTSREVALRIHELNPRTARPLEGRKLAVISPADVVLVPMDDAS